LVPVDAQAVLAYAVDETTFAEANLGSPNDPRLLIPRGLWLTWSDPVAQAGAALVSVRKTYLVFRKESTLPTGSYGLDADTDRPRANGLPTSNARRLPSDVAWEVKPTGSARERQLTLTAADLRDAGVFPAGNAPRWSPRAYRLFLQTESSGGVLSALAPVGFTLRASTSGSPDPLDPAPREERRPAELEWLPAPLRVGLLPAEDASAETGDVHVPMLEADFRFRPELSNIRFKAHPAGQRVVRMRFNHAPSDQRSYALELAASYDVLELELDQHSTLTFGDREQLSLALRQVAEVQIVSNEQAALLPGDTLAPGQWEAFYPSTVRRLAAQRPLGAELELRPWYSPRESVLRWPAWSGLTDAPFERTTQLHPALEHILGVLQSPPSAAIHAGKPLQLDRQGPPPTQPQNLDALLAATASSSDPYGWSILQRLGLAVTFALREPRDGTVLSGPSVLEALAQVLSYFDAHEAGDPSTRWERLGLAHAKQHLFVELLYRESTHVELAADGVAEASRLLAIVQLSLRPTPTPYLHYRAFEISGPPRAQATLTFTVSAAETLWVVNQTEPGNETVIAATQATARKLTLQLSFEGRLRVLMRGTFVPSDPEVTLTDSKTGRLIPAGSFTSHGQPFEASAESALFFTAPLDLIAARIAADGANEPVASAWRELSCYLRCTSSNDPSVPETQKVSLPRRDLIRELLPDLLAWSQRFFDASEPCDGTLGPFVATAYPRASSPSYATPDASGRIGFDRKVEDPWGHTLRYYIRPHARYDRLWRSIQQSRTLFPSSPRPTLREVVPEPETAGVDVVLDRVRPVATPLVLMSSRLDGVLVPGQPTAPGRTWEVIVAEHHEQTLIEHNQTLVRQLAFRGLAFALLRQFAFTEWAEWLAELGGAPIVLDIPQNSIGNTVPLPPTTLEGGPAELDFENLRDDELRTLDLPLRLGVFGQGALALQWEALPFFYRHRLLLVAQSTRVVSRPNIITQEDFEYVTPLPAARRAGIVSDWSPPTQPGSASTPPVRVRAIGVDLSLSQLWEALPSDAQAAWQDEAPDNTHRRPGWLADLGVVYELVELFVGNLETQAAVFFDANPTLRKFARRQLGSHFAVDIGAFTATTDPSAHFKLQLIVQPIAEETLSRAYTESDAQRLGPSTRAKTTFTGDRIRFVGAPERADREQLIAALDTPDQVAIERIAASFRSETLLTAEIALPSSLGELAFVEARSLELIWEGPMSEAEANAIRALRGDPELQAALDKLIAAAGITNTELLVRVRAPLGPEQLPATIASRWTYTFDASGTHYAGASWTGPLHDEDLGALDRNAQIASLRQAVAELRRQADAARFAIVLPPPPEHGRPTPADLPPVLAGSLVIDPELLSWRGRLRNPEQRAALAAMSGDPPFDAAVAELLARLDGQILEVVFVSPVRAQATDLGPLLQGQLLLGRARLSHSGLLAASEAAELAALFDLDVDRRAVERLYRDSQSNPLRVRQLKLRAKRGSATPSTLVDIPLDPLP
jgi:hypothetical protein